MKRISKTFRKVVIQEFWNETRGQDLVEYALAAGLVAVSAVAAMPVLTATVNRVFSRIATIIQSAVN